MQSKLYAITKESTAEKQDIELDQKESENLDDTFGNTLADNTNIFPNSSQMVSLSMLYKKTVLLCQMFIFQKII